MSEPYTPTTETVRERFADGFGRFGYTLALEYFDRWLAEHDRQIAERAWAEGAREQADAYGMDVDVGPNPYRAAKGER